MSDPINQSPEAKMTDDLPDPDLKIILLGDSAVGKSKSALLVPHHPPLSHCAQQRLLESIAHTSLPLCAAL
jgi:hypothetical protein